jgi:uncharacterized DUF497 family protein
MHIHFHHAYESDLISPGICIVQSMVNWKNLDLEFDEHAFKHGIKDYEIEQIFKGKIYKRKIYVNEELRYQIIGRAFGRLIMIIAVPSENSGLKVFSARPASEYKEIYYNKAK